MNHENLSSLPANPLRSLGHSLLELLFTCPACGQKPDRGSFPLCAECQDSLRIAPRLCAKCAGPQCRAVDEQGPCLRPWIEPVPRSRICSYSARYLLIGQGYTVLRRWKTKHGPLFDRCILKDDATLTQHWRSCNADWIIPIPQTAERAWQLGGSPAERISKWISKNTKVPILKAFEMDSTSPHYHHQAKLSLQGRMQNTIPLRMIVPPSLIHGKKLIVVDDFMTTGKTLQTAAAALWTAAEVHLFCLGVRPQRRVEQNDATCSAAQEGP